MKTITDSTRRSVLVFLGLALAALIGRLLADAAGAPDLLVRGLYLFGLGSLVAAVLVIAAD